MQTQAHANDKLAATGKALYWHFPMSFNCHKTSVALAETGLAVDKREVDLLAAHHLRFQSRGEAAYTDAMREALEGEVREEIDDLEALLASDARPFIAGAAYSLADCMWTAILARLSLVGLAGWWADGRRASVGAYFDRVRARPSYAMAGVLHERLRRP